MPHKHGCDLRKGRVTIPGQIYLITTVTHQRKPLFNNFNIGRIVVDSLRYMDRTQRVESLAFVVIPDHLHWLVSPGIMVLYRKSSVTLNVDRRIKLTVHSMKPVFLCGNAGFMTTP